jgi:hypothetical protein
VIGLVPDQGGDGVPERGRHRRQGGQLLAAQRDLDLLGGGVDVAPATGPPQRYGDLRPGQGPAEGRVRGDGEDRQGVTPRRR